MIFYVMTGEAFKINEPGRLSVENGVCLKQDRCHGSLLPFVGAHPPEGRLRIGGVSTTRAIALSL
ncbi:MAG: hypothetical protein GTN81_04750 [Proteobacteria bacterium]|nr:hypothetical protein [Pseudomonadota bacterium]